VPVFISKTGLKITTWYLSAVNSSKLKMNPTKEQIDADHVFYVSLQLLVSSEYY